MSRQTLLTFVGWQDPYHHSAHDDGRIKGPVFTVLEERRFDRVVLLARSHRHEHAERTRAALHEAFPHLVVQIRPLDLPDSTHHAKILAELRRVVKAIRADAPDDDYTVSLLAGTPEIHACWVLLNVAGEFTGRLLNLRRSVHNGFAGPRVLREVNWSDALAPLTADTLGLLAHRAAHETYPSLQDPAATAPRHFFTRRTLDQAAQVARNRSPALLSGEPGTQKHYLAALIHQLDHHSSGPLIIVNCAEVPPDLLESVLLGEPGDAGSGKLREADGGTLVLLKLQRVPGKLLTAVVRAVADGRLYGAQSSVPWSVNVRLIGTTDVDLEEEVRRGRFPADVWQRLQANHVRVPPLRERTADISLLAHEELERANRKLPRPKRLSAGALAKLESHHWTANVSELQRVIEHAILNAESPTIQPADIDLGLGVNIANVFTPAAPRLRVGFSLGDYLRTVKQGVVRSALAKTEGNQSEAARLLGVTPQAISKFLRESAPTPPRRRAKRAN